MAKILLATDGSGRDTRAAQAAVDLLGKEQEYLVVSVGSRPSVEMITSILERPGLSTPRPDGGPEDEAAVESVRATLERLPVRTRGRVVAGDVREALCRAAYEEQADILVLPSHRSGSLHRLLRGSVSSYVLRHAPCAVLVVPEHASCAPAATAARRYGC